MNDLKGINYSFPDFSAVLNFLAGVKPVKDSVNEIKITRDGSEKWKMRMDETQKRAIPVKPPSGAGLYDLYW